MITCKKVPPACSALMVIIYWAITWPGGSNRSTTKSIHHPSSAPTGLQIKYPNDMQPLELLS